MSEQNDLVERLYYWTDDESGYDQHYRSSNVKDDEKIIQIKRLNFFIGRNNSGKSRFLRGCLIGAKNPSHFQALIELPEQIVQELRAVTDEAFGRGAVKQSLIGRGLQTVDFERFSTVLSDFKIALQNKHSPENFNRIKEYLDFLSNLTNAKNINPHTFMARYFFKDVSHSIKTFIEKWELSSAFSDFLYIPTLRGLRPTQPNDSASQTPYADRTIKDYFDPTKQKAENVITGENLYVEITKALLGEPEQRESVRAYEQALSQYFFDGATISLIPKYGEDTINIKIGDDDQRSVTQLGDGLQQVLILTYEAFLKKERCAFFIEEPELHMHAGMLRQLMNFYLNETKHFYFFTTHSNHLVDMVDESSDVMIQKFQKKPKDAENPNGYFQIDQCDRDRDLLAQLGVRPSSVYLSNCTIWVEGITDRLYIHRYMQRYLQDLKDEKSALYAKYQRLMPNYHYSFVEYQGGNLTHWNFDPKTAQDCDKNGGLNANWVCSNALLIADGDIKGKSDRVNILEGQLGECFYLLECKEIENTLPTSLIIKAAKDIFSDMKQKTKKDADITGLDSITDAAHFFSENDGIGRLLDQQLKMQPIDIKNKTTGLMESELARCFADKSGTINNKLEFCRKITALMDDSQEWQLTVSAKALCARIFQHIADQNP